MGGRAGDVVEDARNLCGGTLLEMGQLMTPPAAVWSRRVGHCGIRLSLGIDTGDPENYGRTIRMLEKLVRSALCQPVIAAIVLGKSDPCWSLHHITRR